MAFSFGATAAAELGAPHWVWVGMAGVAGILGLIAIAFGVIAFREWRSERQDAPQEEEVPQPPPDLAPLVAPAPPGGLSGELVELFEVPPGPATLSFKTHQGRSRLLRTNVKPQKLRFTVPVEKVVDQNDLPYTLKDHQTPVLILKFFKEEGIVLEELAGEIAVSAEIYP